MGPAVRTGLERASLWEIRRHRSVTWSPLWSVLPRLAFGPGRWLNGDPDPDRPHPSEARIPGRRDPWSTATGLREIRMGYVHPGKTDIFLSYAHVDDEPDHGDRPGWVTSL